MYSFVFFTHSTNSTMIAIIYTSKYFFIATFFYFQQTTITYYKVRRPHYLRQCEVLAGRGQSGESKKRPLSIIVELLVLDILFPSNCNINKSCDLTEKVYLTSIYYCRKILSGKNELICYEFI